MPLPPPYSKPPRLRHCASHFGVAAAALLLAGCSTLGYYAQAVSGQWRVLRAREPVAAAIADPATPSAVRAQLAAVQDARRWAVEVLRLPDNGSYRSYVALPRDYVVWNVLATPEFSLAPRQQCFLVVGCVAYQGYFDEAAAKVRAASFAARGDDTAVMGVPAYSTLGWFDDPVLSSMLGNDPATLVATVFHELAHQRLFIDDDTRFNESYAEFVASEGLRQYLLLHPGLGGADREQRRHRREQFTQLVLATRAELEALYRQPMADELRRTRKAEVLRALRERYDALRDSEWQGEKIFDRWFDAAPLNNARLLPFGLYDQDLPAFARLYAEAGGDWSRFHSRARQLSRLKPDARRAELARLAARP